MSEIDALTGLPALPEGQFWRVTNKTEWSTYGGCEREIANRFEVRIIEPRTITKTHTTKRRFRKDVTTEEVVESERIVDRESLYILVSEATKTKEAVYDYDLTPEGISVAATRLVERREKKRLEQARKAELLGDYPPKTLKKEEKWPIST